MTALEFTSVVEHMAPTLRPAAYNLTRDSDDAKDLVQETLLKAFVNRNKFKAGTNLKAWLYTIMRNTFINHYNKVTKRTSSIDTADLIQLKPSDDRIVTLNRASGAFALQDIHAAIDKLPEDLRAPFMMYYIGYKYLEIADKLELPIGTVKNRIHLARKELKQELKAYAYAD
ncbi:sigma-70 family RNA polymerase sigma factor [Rufibacter immobilis]|uniref:Sigma-70 family RNA polymerase sigma factor n=1 Tax=Rufibacter immobilis TaxID=1348778 RepID=A0A3M9MQW1_9BACT|nr:sigma-70 family RNA polymerase sigma factor [Rufibacter immobilis]RNI27098.1 sigma-70 family RNA polymerase sigma factor [Rufibacter immobilis]